METREVTKQSKAYKGQKLDGPQTLGELDNPPVTRQIGRKLDQKLWGGRKSFGVMRFNDKIGDRIGIVLQELWYICGCAPCK